MVGTVEQAFITKTLTYIVLQEDPEKTYEIGNIATRIDKGERVRLRYFRNPGDLHAIEILDENGEVKSTYTNDKTNVISIVENTKCRTNFK